MLRRTHSFVLASVVLTAALVAPLAAQGGGGGGRGAGGRGGGGRGGAAAPATNAVQQPPIFGVTPVFPTNDPVIKAIYAIGMDSSWTKKLGHTLFDSIGPRLMGSPNIDAAQNWAVKLYQSWGIDAKREIYGTWRTWRRGYSHIDLISPRVRSLEGTMVGYSPGTKKKNVDAEVIDFPYFADSMAFKAWLPKVKGKLVMLSPAIESCRTPADIRTFATPYTDSVLAADRQTAALTISQSIRNAGRAIALGGGTIGTTLEDAGAAGIITSRPKQTAGVAMEVFETYNVKAPALALTCEDYGLLWRLAESGAKPIVRMNLDAELLGEKPVANVIGTIKGTVHPDEVVLFSAHFDSWDAGSGATDNGTGTLMMMEAMRILKKAYPNPKRTIMVGHWSGEEEGLVGSAAWAADHPEITGKITAFINQDDGTGRLNNISGAGFLSSATMIPGWIARMPDNMRANFRWGGVGSPSRGGGGGGTDTGSFACYGVPTLGLRSVNNWDYSNLSWHTEKDTYDKVSFDDLKWNATLGAMLAYMAADDPQFMTRNTLAQNDSMWKAGPAVAGRGGGGGGRGAAASNLPPGTITPCPPPVRKTNPRLR